MALTQNFTFSQSWGLPSKITLTDTSSGTDAAVVSRKVYITDKDGNYLVEDGTTTDYENWINFPGTTTITLDVLLRDMAVNIRVDWCNVGGSVLYTKTYLTRFDLYAKTYLEFLIKCQSSRTTLIDRANFYYNLVRLFCCIQEALNAIDLMDDISSAQGALDRAYKLINNPSNFF